jgi:DNA-binding transcriptional ArsR family regulator
MWRKVLPPENTFVNVCVMTAVTTLPATTIEMDMDAVRQHAAEVVSTLKVLGNIDRLMLLCQLVQQERTVGELEQLTGITQPTLSQQLGVLRREGVVGTRRTGKFIWYRLEDGRTLQIMQALYALFCAPGATAAQSAAA